MTEQLADMARAVKEEPLPAGETIWNHIYKERG